MIGRSVGQRRAPTAWVVLVLLASSLVAASSEREDGESTGSASRLRRRRRRINSRRAQQQLVRCAPPHSSDRHYSAGDVVGHSGRNYACRPRPHSLNCGRKGYAPGQNNWSSAWTALEACQGGGSMTLINDQNWNNGNHYGNGWNNVHGANNQWNWNGNQNNNVHGAHGWDNSNQNWNQANNQNNNNVPHGAHGWENGNNQNWNQGSQWWSHNGNNNANQGHSSIWWTPGNEGDRWNHGSQNWNHGNHGGGAAWNANNGAPGWNGGPCPNGASHCNCPDGNAHCNQAVKVTPTTVHNAPQGKLKDGECAPQYRERSYAAGEMASNNGYNYECKPFPVTTWCAMSTYAPGTGVGHMAWIERGPCRRDTNFWVGDHVQDGYQEQELITININKDDDDICPNSWDLHHPYFAGDRVTSAIEARGSGYTYRAVYECKEYPFTPTCGDPAAEVGVGPIYDRIWRSVGRCVDGRVVRFEDEIAKAPPAPRQTREPTKEPTRNPTPRPTKRPTKYPSRNPTRNPTRVPTVRPTGRYNRRPTNTPTRRPTERPTKSPTKKPSNVQAKPATFRDDCPPPFHHGGVYSSDDVVSFWGTAYLCLMPRWCGSRSFEPGEGDFWRLAWEELGPCDEVEGWDYDGDKMEPPPRIAAYNHNHNDAGDDGGEVEDRPRAYATFKGPRGEGRLIRRHHHSRPKQPAAKPEDPEV